MTFFFREERRILKDMQIRALCVFCGSSDLLVPAFRGETEALADRMLRENIGLVYGGGSVGLMGVLADRILSGGGTVVGVIPRFLATKELAHAGLSKMIVTETMHARKQEMSRRADAFAVLPGGFGTLDEFFEILTWRQLRLHGRPIVVANPGGWFDPLLAFCRKGVEIGAIAPANLGLFEVVAGGADVVDALRRRRAAAAAAHISRG